MKCKFRRRTKQDYNSGGFVHFPETTLVVASAEVPGFVGVAELRRDLAAARDSRDTGEKP